MKKNKLILMASCFSVAAVLLTGCSSDTSDDRLTITASNAADTVASAVSSTNTATGVLSYADDPAMNTTTTSLVSTPTGIRASRFCDGGNGSFDNDYTETNKSRSGTIMFSGCKFIFNSYSGSLSYNLDWTVTDGPYTYKFTGSLSTERNNVITTDGNLDYEVSGDTSTGDYTVNKYDNSVNFSNGRGYTITLQDPLSGNVNDSPTCPMSGAVIVNGANGTRARGTIDYPNVDIDFDDGSGVFTPVDTVPCTNIFPVDRPFLLRNL